MSSETLDPEAPATLVIVGAGPRGTGLIERIAANAPELYAGSGLDIHLVDPHPPGAGRIWRAAQSPLLWMNSHAEDVTMFTDESVEMAGPVRPGPTLHEWAGIDGRTFADRQLQGSYLRWVHEQAVAALPPEITVHHHPGRALRVSGPVRDASRCGWKAGTSPCPPISSSSLTVISTPNSTMNNVSWRPTRRSTGSSICRRTSRPTATCPRCRPANPCWCVVSGSPSST